MHKNFKDLTGEVFGKLRVLGLNGKDKHNAYCWNCLCSCGVEKTVRGSKLTTGSIKSCGCLKYKFENLANQRFGRLVVESYDCKHGREHYWSCVCDCGERISVRGNSLRSKNTISCGCYQKDKVRDSCTKHGLKKKGCYSPEYEKYRRKDPTYVLRKNCRALVYQALRRKGGSKAGQSFFNFVEYSVEELKEHLESLFEDWMSWDNYGEWHIDHITPQDHFQFKSMGDEEFKKCWALENLRPLAKKLNLKKGNKLQKIDA